MQHHPNADSNSPYSAPLYNHRNAAKSYHSRPKRSFVLPPFKPPQPEAPPALPHEETAEWDIRRTGDHRQKRVSTPSRPRGLYESLASPTRRIVKQNVHSGATTLPPPTPPPSLFNLRRSGRRENLAQRFPRHRRQSAFSIHPVHAHGDQVETSGGGGGGSMP